ncbi:MAG: hypothetical protein PHQ98_01530 [Candidatus ainarchaeum sp.]|nr:hypothetical protein [Candidatus ainarchaeum sp.]
MGIYSSLEDKWYDLLDKIDNVLPIYKLIDPIDNIVPSFILFSLIFLFIFIGIIFVLTQSNLNNNYLFEVVVLGKDGFPIEGAKIKLPLAIGEDELVTDASGKAMFASNESLLQITVSKSNFNSISKTIDASTGVVTLILSPMSNDSLAVDENSPNLNFVNKKFYFTIYDSAFDYIPGASLKINCDGKINELNSQTKNGFEFTLEQGCVNLSLTASAVGFTTKSKVIKSYIERDSIVLDAVSRNGSVTFVTKNDGVALSNVSLVVTNSLGVKVVNNQLTGSYGNLIVELENGDYTYTAKKNGKIMNGEFSLKTNEAKTVTIDFIGDVSEIVATSSSKYIAFEILDNSSNLISGANIEIYQDGILLPDNFASNSKGQTISMIIDQNYYSSNYLALVKATNYETKIVTVELQTVNNYQKVILSSPGPSLKLTVKDDINNLLKNASVSIKLVDLNYKSIANGALINTDSNGVSLIKNLINDKNLFIQVIDSARKDTYEGFITLTNNEAKELEITLVTGTGKITFNFIDESNKSVSLNFNVYADNNLIYNTTNSSYTTNYLKVGTKVKLDLNSDLIFPMQSNEYIVNRTTQTYTIFVRNKSSIPNNNEIQMFLRGVYSTNPIESGRLISSQKIDANKEYYLLFDTVLNSTNLDLNVLSNFVVSDINSFWIKNVFSIENALIKFTDNFTTQLISESLDLEKSKQANVLFYNQNAPKSLPIIIHIGVDENATGKLRLSYNSRAINVTSFDYNFDFNIGKNHNIGNQPPFFIENYLVSGTTRKLISSSLENIYLDNVYSIETVVYNNSDKDYGNVNLTYSIPSVTNGIRFSGDLNTIEKTINLPPFSSSSIQTVSLDVLNKKTGQFTLSQKLTKIENGLNSLNGIDGSTNDLKLKLQEKSQITLSVSPVTLTAKVNNPLVVIQTKVSSRPISVNYAIQKKVNGDWQETGLTGTTDTNGYSLIQFNALNYSKDDVIRVVATDINQMYSTSVKELTFVENSFILNEEIITSCVKVKLDNIEINGLEKNKKLLENNTFTFVIDFNCTSDTLVQIDTELELSSKSITKKTGSETITVTAKTLNNIYGVYPIKIFQKSGSSSNQLALIDVIINPASSCFDFNESIFDLTNKDKVSSQVENTCFTGRKDNFYPKLDNASNSISIQYHKPGNPEYIDFNINIVGSALEGIVQGGHTASKYEFSQTGGEESSFISSIGTSSNTGIVSTVVTVVSAVGFGVAPVAVVVGDAVAHEVYNVGGSSPEVTQLYPDEPYFLTDAYNFAVDLYNSYQPGSSIVKSKPDTNFTSPSKPLGRMPTTEELNSLNSLFELGDTISSDPMTGQEAGANNTLSSDAGTEWPISDIVDGMYGEFPMGGAGTLSGPESSDAMCGETGGDGFFVDNPDDFYISQFGCNKTGTSNADFVPESANVTGHFNPLGQCTDNDCGGNVNSSDLSLDHISKIWNNDSRWYAGNQLLYVGSDGGKTWWAIPSCSGCGEGECELTSSQYFGEGFGYQIYKVKGYTDGWLYPIEETTFFDFQKEYVRRTAGMYEIRKVQVIPVHLKTTENKVYQLGSVSNATPSPQLVGVDSWNGQAIGETTAVGENITFTPAAILPTGFIDPAIVYGKEGCVITPNRDSECELNLAESTWGINWALQGAAEGAVDPFYVYRPASDPLVEYSSNGLIMYYIDHNTIPGWTNGNPSVRMFLKGGQVFAEYVGIPEVSSNVIDFNVINNGLIGDEYVNLTISDWTSSTAKSTIKYRIKVKGDPSSCVSNDGVLGNTGASNVPRVIFNWNYDEIDDDQCDSTNSSYTYCDGVQFNISLFKKLSTIEDLVNSTGSLGRVADKTAFYSYLIKDNYNLNLLNDFKNYYANKLFDGSTEFKDKFSNYITENKISYILRNPTTLDLTTLTNLPYSGIYRVEIDLGEIGNKNSMFTNNIPDNTIRIILTPILDSSNNNPFYNLPFDGEVGKTTRNGYGVGVMNGEFKLNATGTITSSSSDALIKLNIVENNNLDYLNSGTVLSYQLTDDLATLILSFSQPTPAILTIKNETANTNIHAGFSITGENKDTIGRTNWKLTNSNLGTSTECKDFKGNDELKFNTVSDGNGFYFNWSNASLGQISLSKVFFTPLQSSNILKISPINSVLTSFSEVQNNASILLNYYDAKNITSYYTLEGIFNSIKENEMCISQTSSDDQKIWWNKDYTNKLITTANTNSTRKCS